MVRTRVFTAIATAPSRLHGARWQRRPRVARPPARQAPPAAANDSPVRLPPADSAAAYGFTSTGLSRYAAGKVLARFSTFGTSFTMMYMLYGCRTR
ncbi:hypothetical protein LMG26842_04881 [Achromobacter dolens]|nr:hypothetical protein LMG26842_04881 [Achromobacter dolens]